jgi:hypothetical protein
MASKRCIPTRFFKDPDIMNLSNHDTRLILIGLVLCADDEGRELAHVNLLGRELDYSPEQIESALQDLADNDLLILYQVGKHRYYSLTRWGQWQTLSSTKITLSKHPAPPTKEDAVASSDPDQPGFPGELPTAAAVPPGNPGKSWETSPQFKLSESKLSEEEEKETAATNITPFPTPAHNDTTTADAQVQTMTKQVAHILKLPVSHALTRLVATYTQETTISLLIEADAAREWIENPKRNHTHKPMAVHFFRTWLKRERADVVKRDHATGTDGPATGNAPPAAATVASGPKRKSLMGLEAEYRAACAQKGDDDGRTTLPTEPRG